MAVGDRIQAARRMRGLSMRDLAVRIDKSHMAVKKYESGALAVSSSLLLALSRALGVKLEYFLRAIEVPEVVPAYRKRRGLPAKEATSVSEEIREWLERYAELLSLFPDAQLGFEMPSGFPVSVAQLREVEEAATGLRAQWRLGLDAIEDVTAILEGNGIVVGLIHANRKFDACTFTVESESPLPVILARHDLPGDRQRFSLCHELGHLLVHADQELDEDKMADRFAAAFLVPRETAIAELGSQRTWIDPSELRILKAKYGLSMMGWVCRARDLGIITDARATVLFKTFSKKNWRAQEPGPPMGPETPKRFRQLVAQAVAEKQITERKASELLGKASTESLDDGEFAAGGLLVGLGSR